MGGDLIFRWETSNGLNYFPSSKKYDSGVYLTQAPFKASIVDFDGRTIREDELYSIVSDGNGIFSSSFAGEANIKVNTKYKIKICDFVSGQNICDISDNYFIVQ
jgi:hypothetical protein